MDILLHPLETLETNHLTDGSRVSTKLELITESEVLSTSAETLSIPMYLVFQIMDGDFFGIITKLPMKTEGAEYS